MNQPSKDFVRRGRDPDVAPPRRFEPTVKAPGTFILTSKGLVEVKEDHNEVQ